MVGFSGHRQMKPGDVVWLVRAALPVVVAKLRDEHGMQIGLSGMALCGDMWWARAVLDAGVAMQPHIPFPQQPDPWPAAEQARWRQLRGEGFGEVVYGDLSGMSPALRKLAATPLLHARNAGMVAASDAMVVAHYPWRREGGTAGVLKILEREKRRPFVRINLDSHEITVKTWTPL